MKIALICDLHYGNKNDSPIFHDYFKRSADWFLGILDSEKINTIIDLGDLLHRRKYVNYVTANRLRTDFLDPIEARGIKHYLIAGNHDCLDSETECLTKRGWLKYDEIRPNDEVFSMKEKGVGEWTPIQNIIIKPYSGDMVKVKSRTIDMLMTPNHRVLLQYKNYPYTSHHDIEYMLAKDLKGTFEVYKSAVIDKPDYDISDKMLRLLGWIITDGHIGKKSGRITIYQSKKHFVNEIIQLLDDLNIKYHVRERASKVKEIHGKLLKKQPLNHFSFSMYAESYKEINKLLNRRKEFPDFTSKLSKRQFDILMTSIIDGDGTWNKSKNGATIYGSKKFIDDLQRYCVEFGWRTKVVYPLQKIYVLKSIYTDVVTRKSKSFMSYSGIVWCLSVPNTNFMVRRNGEAYFTGNCYYRNTSEINALDELIGNRYKNLHFFKEPWTLCFQGLSILLIPWINESNKQVTYDAIKDSKAPIAMGHLEISGFEMFRGLFSDHGDSKEIYDKFDQVFSGHYHHKSSIGNITYLGAFTEQTWADFNDPKGFHIFDTKSRELTFYKNPISIFKVITYDDADPATMDFSSYRDCYVKVAVLNRPNAYKFEQFMDTLSRSGALDISVVEDSSSITEINEEMSIDESQDTGTILTKYIENLTGLPVPNDKMIKYMTEIYNEALNMETTIDSA